MSETENDLNATIAAAVNARVSAQVAAALSGDEVIGAYVTSALTRTVTVKEGYRDKQVKWIDHAVAQAIQSATKDVIAEVLAAEMDQIRTAVRDAVQSQVGRIADDFATNLTEKTAKDYYRINVGLHFPGSD